MRSLRSAYAILTAMTIGLSAGAASAQLPSIPNGHLIANATGETADAGDTQPSSWFDQAYCSTIGSLIVRLTGAWTCAYNIPADPVWWGADPSGINDSTAAFNSAVGVSRFVRLQPGTFKFDSALTVNGSFTLMGSGAGQTILLFPN